MASRSAFQFARVSVRTILWISGRIFKGGVESKWCRLRERPPRIPSSAYRIKFRDIERRISLRRFFIRSACFPIFRFPNRVASWGWSGGSTSIPTMFGYMATGNMSMPFNPRSAPVFSLRRQIPYGQGERAILGLPGAFNGDSGGMFSGRRNGILVRLREKGLRYGKGYERGSLVFY